MKTKVRVKMLETKMSKSVWKEQNLSMIKTRIFASTKKFKLSTEKILIIKKRKTNLSFNLFAVLELFLNKDDI